MPFRSPLTVKKLKNPPPEDTGQESGYLKLLGDKQTPVAVKLAGGENPSVNTGATDRVFRGGCWYDSARFCRLRYRRGFAPSFQCLGPRFRLPVCRPSSP